MLYCESHWAKRVRENKPVRECQRHMDRLDIMDPQTLEEWVIRRGTLEIDSIYYRRSHPSPPGSPTYSPLTDDERRIAQMFANMDRRIKEHTYYPEIDLRPEWYETINIRGFIHQRRPKQVVFEEQSENGENVISYLEKRLPIFNPNDRKHKEEWRILNHNLVHFLQEHPEYNILPEDHFFSTELEIYRAREAIANGLIGESNTGNEDMLDAHVNGPEFVAGYAVWYGEGEEADDVELWIENNRDLIAYLRDHPEESEFEEGHVFYELLHEYQQEMANQEENEVIEQSDPEEEMSEIDDLDHPNGYSDFEMESSEDDLE